MHRGGGPMGARGAPLELGIYRVTILKIRKISFFLLIGPPLGKNRSPAPGHAPSKGSDCHVMASYQMWFCQKVLKKDKITVT